MTSLRNLTRALIFMGIALVTLPAHGQGYTEWLKQQQAEQKAFNEKEREAFKLFVKERDEAIKKLDADFQEFLKQEWKNYELFKAEELEAKPKPSTEPEYTGSGSTSATELKIEEVATIEAGATAEPRLPVYSASVPENYNAANASFGFYGSDLKFRYDQNTLSSFPSAINEETISAKWEAMSQTNYADLLNQLQSYKVEMNLNDWGYYLLVKNAASEISSNDNGSIFLQWFFLTKSNYKARLAFKDSRLFLLLPSSNNIYGMPFFTFDNLRYYLMDSKESDIFTYDKDFPEARIIMDLNVYKPINTKSDMRPRTVKFAFNGQDYAFDVNYNQNAINFYKDYPLADIEVYFDAVITQQTKESLTRNLMPMIQDMPEEEAVLLLLRFVQKAFDYQTDQQQFGREKFFFPDELFYYPYSDCEDRSVLFAYLTKQLLGLDVIGLNYPGHMATAVKFHEEVNGDYINYKGDKYVVCDPTYVNAPIGQTMPQYAESNAIIVQLRTSSQSVDRARKYWKLANKKGLYQGGTGNNIVFDEEGCAYLCGYFSGEVDFLGFPMKSVNNTNDVFVAKISPSKGVEYAFPIGSAGNDIAYNITLGKDNSFYFTGSFNKNLKIGSKTLYVKNNSDIFLAKCSRDGELMWVNQAGIEQLDSLNNLFVAHFDENGKKIWTRTYEESEDFSDYGITVDEAGKAFVSASLVASAGMDVSTKTYESYTTFDPVDLLMKENERLLSASYDPGIAGLFAVLYMIENSGTSLPGAQAQKAIDQTNPSFRKNSPNIYQNIGRIEFIRNSQGIVTIRTDDGNDVKFSSLQVKNNSKIKISMYNSGNAQIDILSGVTVGGSAIISYDLNFVRLNKSSGDLVLDYDNDHTQKKVNVQKDILF